MIREAKTEDLGELIRMGRAFAERVTACPFHQESYVRTVIMLMSGYGFQHSALWVIDRGNRLSGVLGAIAAPVWFNMNYTDAQELYWWVDEDYRGKGIVQILDRFDAWAAEIGARQAILGKRAQLASDGLQRFYESRGYVENETSFVKILGD